MTPQEFKDKMIRCWDYSDPGNNEEVAHIDADDLMCNLLRELGYGDGVDIFEKNGKWYS